MCVWWVRGTSGFTNNHCFHVDKVKVLTTGEAAWLTAGSANRSLVTIDQLFTKALVKLRVWVTILVTLLGLLTMLINY